MLGVNLANPRERRAEQPKNSLPGTNMLICSEYGTDGWEACVKYPMMTLPNGTRVQMGMATNGVVPGTQVSGFGTEEAAREAACVLAKITYYGIDLANRI